MLSEETNQVIQVIVIESSPTQSSTGKNGKISQKYRLLSLSENIAQFFFGGGYFFDSHCTDRETDGTKIIYHAALCVVKYVEY